MTEENSYTLRQGLEMFRQGNAEYLSHDKKGISVEAKNFFASHDIAHVLFDCDISLFGEGSVKLWTILGTSLGFWNHIQAYKEASAFELARNFGFVHILSNIFMLLLSVPILIIKARQMHKLWPWSEFDSYLDKPLSEIRKEFNIRV